MDASIYCPVNELDEVNREIQALECAIANDFSAEDRAALCEEWRWWVRRRGELIAQKKTA